ncbi:hypothetical protein CY34DRAFT_640067 [Suillus luteus UH-Slu-Lm8-n1]|uniref:Uncharacterized protein n=1 Tax=Suillus luteus UH-Slu-Lm8-n1 TaxID=930992 RepID=A0A0D0AJP8_9AGAM|nr:hypothetical protein CY34DRAFT_640067 [Suillus luteus UH-Slu-Lm8-n1]
MTRTLFSPPSLLPVSSFPEQCPTLRWIPQQLTITFTARDTGTNPCAPTSLHLTFSVFAYSTTSQHSRPSNLFLVPLQQQLFYQLYIRSFIYIAKHGEIESMMYLMFPSTSASCRIPVARSVTGGIWFRWSSIRVRMDVLTSIWSNARMFRDETWSLETAVVDQLLCQRQNRWC